MRILMVGPVPFLYGGISKVVGSFLQTPYPGLEISYVALSTKRSLVYKAALFVWGLIQVLYELLFRRPDAAHLHFSRGASIYRKWAAQKICALFKVPVVVQSHTFLPEIDIKHSRSQIPDFYERCSFLGKRIVTLFLNRADGIVVLSERIKLSLQNITGNKDIWILRNPVDCQKYTPGSREASPLKVLFMGDSSKRKGVKVLVKAASEVIRQRPEVRFILCGGGRKKIREMTEEWGIEECAEVPGFVSGKKKREYFKNADLFVLPSFSEGLPVSILEAMASGLSIVATPVGGIPDVLKEHQNALLLRPGDSQTLTERMLFLLTNKDVRDKIGENNRKKALDEFDTPVVMRDLKEIYVKAIQKKNAKD